MTRRNLRFIAREQAQNRPPGKPGAWTRHKCALFRVFCGVRAGARAICHHLARGALPVKAANSVPVRFFALPSLRGNTCPSVANSGPALGRWLATLFRAAAARQGFALEPRHGLGEALIGIALARVVGLVVEPNACHLLLEGSKALELGLGHLG